MSRKFICFDGQVGSKLVPRTGSIAMTQEEHLQKWTEKQDSRPKQQQKSTTSKDLHHKQQQKLKI